MFDLRVKDLTLLAKRKIIPISVMVEVCYQCNENCVHCCLSDHTETGLMLTQYEMLFDQFVEAGTFFVILTGGEPFVRPDFMDIVYAARKRRLSVTIFSNATLLTPSMIAELRALYVQEFHVSIYSANPKIHDGITRLPGSFAKSVENIRKLVATGMTVRIKCPLMNTTYPGIGEIKRLARELGVSIQFTTVITARNNGDSSTHDFRLTREQLADALSDPDISEGSVDPVRFGDHSECIPCETILNGGSIDFRGDVYPCNQWQVCGGNVLETPFGRIWQDSPVFKALRSIKLTQLTQCSNCELFQRCTRCPGLALLEDGRLNGCSASAKMLAEVRQDQNIYPVKSHIFSTSE